MAYNDIRNGMKGTPMSLEQRATANKMNMLNKRPSPLEQAMIPKGNFEPIAPPKGIFEPPSRPKMDIMEDIKKEQMPDVKNPYLPMQGDVLTAPKGNIGTPPPKQPIGMAPIPPVGQPDVLTAPKGNMITPPTPPAVLPPPPLQQTSPSVPQSVVEPDIISAPQIEPPKIDVTPPPMGGSALPPPPMGGGLAPPPKPPVGGGITPPSDIQHGTTPPVMPSAPAAQTSTPAQQAWQDNTIAASTSSFQNPYTNISGEMGSGVDFLRDQGINVTSEYEKYFQDYDPTGERAAIQQYGLGQDATIAAARSNLMQMTQQGLGGGFSGIGFGGAAASGVRSQFGLGAQQAGLSLRGDIYGMRRQQEEDWWNTLASVEQRRGEMFEFGNNGYDDGGYDGGAGGTYDAPDTSPTWNPPANPIEDQSTYMHEGTEYIFTGGNWMSQASYQGAGE
jgi:hypothetical protein